jgi:uncharacterized protein (UPF0332 family)
VSPEVADCLNRARLHLEKARNFLNVLHYSDEAARAAYLAGFNAAQALVFTHRGRIARTHRGLRSAFAELARDQLSLDPGFTRFLAEAYRSKENVDYGGGDAAPVTEAEAQQMIETADRFIKAIAKILA